MLALVSSDRLVHSIAREKSPSKWFSWTLRTLDTVYLQTYRTFLIVEVVLIVIIVIIVIARSLVSLLLFQRTGATSLK
jgi:hypothetical protein